MNISIYKVLKDSVQKNQNISSESELSDAQALNFSSTKKSNKRVKPAIDYQTEIDAELKKFGDLKSLADNFIAVAASKNKTGTIAQSMRLSLLCQLSDVLTAADDKGVFKEALLEVIARGVDNINYLKKVIESKKQKHIGKEDLYERRTTHLRKVLEGISRLEAAFRRLLKTGHEKHWRWKSKRTAPLGNRRYPSCL